MQALHVEEIGSASEADSALTAVIKFAGTSEQFNLRHQTVVASLYTHRLVLQSAASRRRWHLGSANGADNVVLAYCAHDETCLILTITGERLKVLPVEQWKSDLDDGRCGSLLALLDISALTWLSDEVVDIPNLQVFRIPRAYRFARLPALQSLNRQSYTLVLSSADAVVAGTFGGIGFNRNLFEGHCVKEFALQEVRTLYKEHEPVKSLTVIGDKVFWSIPDALRIVDLRTHTKIGYVALKDPHEDGQRFILAGVKNQVYVITESGMFISVKLVIRSAGHGIAPTTIAHVCSRDHIRFNDQGEQSWISGITHCHVLRGCGNILITWQTPENQPMVGIADTTGCVTTNKCLMKLPCVHCYGFGSLRVIDGSRRVTARKLSEAEQMLNILKRLSGSEGQRLSQGLKEVREWFYSTADMAACEASAVHLYKFQKQYLLIDVNCLSPLKKAAYMRGCLQTAATPGTEVAASSEVLKYFGRCLPFDCAVVMFDCFEENAKFDWNHLATEMRRSQAPVLAAVAAWFHIAASVEDMHGPQPHLDQSETLMMLDAAPCSLACRYLILRLLQQEPELVGASSRAVSPDAVDRLCQSLIDCAQSLNQRINEVDMKTEVELRSERVHKLLSQPPWPVEIGGVFIASLRSGTQEFVSLCARRIIRGELCHAPGAVLQKVGLASLTAYFVCTSCFQWEPEEVETCAKCVEVCQLVLSFLSDVAKAVISDLDFDIMPLRDQGRESDRPCLGFLIKPMRTRGSSSDHSCTQIPITNAGERKLLVCSQTLVKQPPALKPETVRRASVFSLSPPSPTKMCARRTELQSEGGSRRFSLPEPKMIYQLSEQVVTAEGLLCPANWCNLRFGAGNFVSLACFSIRMGKIRNVFQIFLNCQFMLWAGIVLVCGELHDCIEEFTNSLRTTDCGNRNCEHYCDRLSGRSAETGSIMGLYDPDYQLLSQAQCALNLADVLTAILDDRGPQGMGAWEHELVSACSSDPRSAVQSFVQQARLQSIKSHCELGDHAAEEISKDNGSVGLHSSANLESARSFASAIDEMSEILPSNQWNTLQAMSTVFKLQWSPCNAFKRITHVTESIQDMCKYLLEDDEEHAAMAAHENAPTPQFLHQI